MKQEVYKAVESCITTHASEPKKIRRWAFEPMLDDSIQVILVDNNGVKVNRGYIFSLHSDGTFSRNGYICEDRGLQRDATGRIIERGIS